MKWLMQNKWLSIFLATIVALSVGVFTIDTKDDTAFYNLGNGTIVQAPPGASLFMAEYNRVYILTAGGGWSSTDSGCAAAAKYEYDTNDITLWEAAFDPDSDESMEWTAWTTPNFGGSSGTVTVKATFVWTAHSAASGNVTWMFAVNSYTNDDAIELAWAGTQSVCDDYIADDDVHISSSTSAITITGGVSANEMLQFRATRDANHATDDTLAYDAQLLMVIVKFRCK